MTNGESDVGPRDGHFAPGDAARQLARLVAGLDGEKAEGGRNVWVREILFVELLGGLGDILISLAAIQALARSHPEARLTVLTFPPGGELLEHDPMVHEVVHASRPDPAHPYRAREAVEKLLTQRHWDLVVSDTSYDGLDAVICSSGTPRTVTNLWRSPPPDERVGERFLSLLSAEGLIEPSAISPARLHLTLEERSAAT